MPGAHHVIINGNKKKKDDVREGGSGMSGLSGYRRDGLLSRVAYLNYIRRQRLERLLFSLHFDLN